MSRAAIGWAAIGVTLVLTVWASLPNSPLFGLATNLIPGGDKTGHVLVMGLLAGGCVLAFAGRSVRGWELTPVRLLVLVALGVTLDEAVQAVIPARTFDWGDLAASLAGVVLIGGLAAVAVTRRASSS